MTRAIVVKRSKSARDRDLFFDGFKVQIYEDLTVKVYRGERYMGGVQHYADCTQIEIRFADWRGSGCDYETTRHEGHWRYNLRCAFLGIRKIVAQYQAEQFAMGEM